MEDEIRSSQFGTLTWKDGADNASETKEIGKDPLTHADGHSNNC